MLRSTEGKFEELYVGKEEAKQQSVREEEKMLFEHRPFHYVAALVASLRACVKQKDLSRGSRLHAGILKLGLLENNIYVGNTLINLYAKCGALAKAQKVFDELQGRDVVSWNSLIAGYAQNDNGEDALRCFEEMQTEGLSPNAVTLVSILKACGRLGAADKGIGLHAEIVKQGLLEKDIFIGNGLVDMYAKCGMHKKAQEVFYELPVRDIVSWNALITGYAQHKDSDKALRCYQLMLNEGVAPDAVTLICILKACGNAGTVDKGKEMHAWMVEEGLLDDNVVVGNALVDMYAKCGALAQAREVFDKLEIRNVVSWNALITGYVQYGHYEKALNCFERMQHEDVSPDIVTLICILKACGSIGADDKGKQIHDDFVKNSSLEENIVIGNALLDMYAKCGSLTKAQEVFSDLRVHDVVSWTSLIAGYSQHGHGEEALNSYERMQQEGFPPSPLTFVCILKACGSVGATEKGKELHADIDRARLLEKDVLIGNALVSMYAKCGALRKAQEMFDGLQVRDAVTWNALIAGYAQQGHSEEALNCFELMRSEGFSPSTATFLCILKACGSIGSADKGKDIHAMIVKGNLLDEKNLVGNALVDMYAKCGILDKALEVFDKLKVRSIVSWTALMAGFTQLGYGEEALNCFERMRCEGLYPDRVTFVCLLKACGILGASVKGKEIHAEICREGHLEKDALVGNALVDMYAKCGELAKAQEVFDKLQVCDVVSWTALIAGYVQHGHGEEALIIFESMKHEGFSPNIVTYICILKACSSIGAADKGKEIHAEIAREGLLDKSIPTGNALVDMYAKCGALAKAQEVFDELQVRDVISWNVLLSGYVQHGHVEEALNLFDKMQHENLSPDAITFVSILKACGSLGTYHKGKEIHMEMVREGLIGKEVLVGNALVDMYAKCGALGKAQEVFDELPTQKIASWNALIAGYAQHGHGEGAVTCFEQMQSKGLFPDALTFTNVLNACSHSGLLEMSQNLFAAMSTLYGITPKLEHFTSMVDLFGRIGNFDKAVALIKTMPTSDYHPLWTALLSACRKWGNVKLGRLAFEQAVLLDGKDHAAYICMSNIYAGAAAMQDDADMIEAGHRIVADRLCQCFV